MFQYVEVVEMAKFYCIKHHLFRRSFVIRAKKMTSKLHMFSSEHSKLEKKLQGGYFHLINFFAVVWQSEITFTGKCEPLAPSKGCSHPRENQI